MIRWTRTAQSTQDNMVNAREWAKEVTSYLNQAFPQAKAHCFNDRFGQLNVITWMIDFESLANLDAYQKAVNEDEKYHAIVNRAAGLFVVDRFIDRVFETA